MISGWTSARTTTAFDEFVMHVDGWLCEIKDVQIRDGLHVLGQAPEGDELINLVLAILRAEPGLRRPGQRRARAADARSGWPRAPADPGSRSTASRRRPARWSRRVADAGWSADAVPGRRRPRSSASRTPASRPRCEFACRRGRAAAAPDRATRSPRPCTPWTAATSRPGPSGSPLRGLVNVLPTGRNFYSVDPKAIPSRLAYQTGQAMAESLLRRHLDETGGYPPSVGPVGLGHLGDADQRRRHRRGAGPARGAAGLGRGLPPGRRAGAGERSPSSARPRIDVTVRISGFFRDAFPHVVAMLDDAVRLVAERDEPARARTTSGAHAQADLARHGDERRATTRIFGSKPGSYGAGILPLIEAGNWRNDQDLAEVYSAWGGFAYGRDLDGIPAREDMEANYRRIAVAAKNIDTREHDIADSDDYFQYHGGMVATVRALTGSAPKAYVGDSTTPDAVAHPLADRGDRAGVPGPGGQPALDRRHAAARLQGRVRAGRDRRLPVRLRRHGRRGHRLDVRAAGESYVLDKQNQDFMKHANPWALRGIIEKLSEAADRGLWAEPDPELMAAMQQVYLDVEGDLEDVPAEGLDSAVLPEAEHSLQHRRGDLAIRLGLRATEWPASTSSNSVRLPSTRHPSVRRAITSGRHGHGGPQRRSSGTRTAALRLPRRTVSARIPLWAPVRVARRCRSGRVRVAPIRLAATGTAHNSARPSLIMTVTSVSVSGAAAAERKQIMLWTVSRRVIPAAKASVVAGWSSPALDDASRSGQLRNAAAPVPGSAPAPFSLQRCVALDAEQKAFRISNSTSFSTTVARWCRGAGAPNSGCRP